MDLNILRYDKMYWQDLGARGMIFLESVQTPYLHAASVIILTEQVRNLNSYGLPHNGFPIFRGSAMTTMSFNLSATCW